MRLLKDLMRITPDLSGVPACEGAKLEFFPILKKYWGI
jgi:hypothetical protein